MATPPPALIGQFDIVHLRMWASNLWGKDISILISHVKSLLSTDCSRQKPEFVGITNNSVAEPGGFIQWEDADLVHQFVEGAKAKEFELRINEVFGKAGLDYR